MKRAILDILLKSPTLSQSRKERKDNLLILNNIFLASLASLRENRVFTILSILIIIFILLIPSFSYGAQPIDVLKDSIDKVLVILEESKGQDSSSSDDPEQKIWEIVKQIFDFNEIARSTIARHWRRFTDDQKKEFAEVFGRFLGATYLGFSSEYNGEKVEYLGSEMITDSKARVETKVLRNNSEVPVDYSMILTDGQWRIYDVKIEGVSLVKNYRSQFNSILAKESPEKLIDMITKKAQEQ